MGYHVSIFLDSLDYLTTGLGDLPLHGANMTARQLYRAFAADDAVDRFEVVTPPGITIRVQDLNRVALDLLPPHRQGRGVFSVVPVHSLPEAWADGRRRVLLIADPNQFPRARYLRDSFATGPTPIVSDTHALGHHSLWPHLQRLAQAGPVAFDSIVCISTTVEEALRKAFDGFVAPAGSPAPVRLDHIPHHVNLETFRPVDEAGRRAARREVGLPEDGVITMYLGRVSYRDKAELLPLFKAFAGASTEEDEYLLVAGKPGDPAYPDELLRLAEELGFAERLLFRPDVPLEGRSVFFAAADIFAFPGDTIQEALGNTILEAMATGLPVIASDWDGFPDMVEDGSTGFLVPTLSFPLPERVEMVSPALTLGTEHLLVVQSVWVDAAALQVALGSLLRSPGLRAEMGAAGRRVVEQRFSWPFVRSRWLSLWDALLAAAEAETAEQRTARQAGANALGLPTPYRRLFHHYAGNVADPDRHAFRLSRIGREVVENRRRLAFHNETLALLRPEVVGAVLKALSSGEETRLTLRALTELVGRQTGARLDDVTYHVAALLKRDLLEPDSSAEDE